MNDTSASAPATATTRDTKAALLHKSGRKGHAAPIRAVFVQQGTRGRPEPAPLATLVKHHDEIGLDLFLLVHAIASAAPYAVHLPAPVWVRALGLGAIDAASLARVSRAWARLERFGLVERRKFKRLAHIVLLREDGRGEEYTPPKSAQDRYIKLSFDYWLDDWDSTLSLPAKSVLLIALTLRNAFPLPIERGPAWYGISADTIDRGLRELQDQSLLACDKVRRVAPLSPRGYTIDYRYTLRGPVARVRTRSP